MLKQLQHLDRWLCWQIVPHGDRLVKTPFNPLTGRPASSNDPSTWVKYAEAKAAVDAGQYASVGFALGKEVGLVVIDFDKVRDSADQPFPDWVLQIVGELDTYTEVSASGRGLHVLGFGSIPSNLNRQGLHIECWDSNKMFAFSGDIFGGRNVIRQRDFSSLYDRILNGRLGPNLVIERHGSDKFRRACADQWQADYGSRSDAVQGVLWTLARKHNFDADAMRKEFESTSLCSAWAEKWERLGEREIARAITEVRRRESESAPVRSTATALAELPIFEEAQIELPAATVPRLDIARYDHLDALAEELSTGTIIPFSYARELVKMFALALLPDSRPQLAWFPGMHVRQYTMLVSDTPESGKGESFKRVRDTFAEYWALGDEPISAGSIIVAGNPNQIGPLKIVSGDMLGSPEYAVRHLGGIPVNATPPPDFGLLRHLVNYDEGAKLVQKDRKGENGQVIAFTSAFEENLLSAGSIKNDDGGRRAKPNLYLLLNFTLASFYRSFAGARYVSDGFASRCVLVADRKNQVSGDWRQTRPDVLRRLVGDIEADCQCTFLLAETEEARNMRLEFTAHLATLDPQYSARLHSLFARDLYARAVFSPAGEVNKRVVELAAKWTEHQYLTRRSLWPQDISDDQVESFCASIRAALGRHSPLSDAKLRAFCNVVRPGSGGEEKFVRAKNALLKAHVIEVVGKTQRERPVYSLCE